MRLPTARDPWVLMQMSPGMMIDRENVGGSDSGQQSGYFGHGSCVGRRHLERRRGQHHRQQRPRRRPRLPEHGRLRRDPDQLRQQRRPVPDGRRPAELHHQARRQRLHGHALRRRLEKGLAVPQHPRIAEGLPADLHGRRHQEDLPLRRQLRRPRRQGQGSGSTAPTASRTWAPFGITGVDDNTFLESGYFRLDAQLAKNTRANLFYEYDNKQKWGRTNWGAALQAPETVWNQVGPTPIYKAELEQMFGNLFLNAKWAYTHNIFHLIPKLGRGRPDGGGPYQSVTTSPSSTPRATSRDYNTVRPQTNISFNGNFFAENVLGADHEFKFGVDYIQVQRVQLLALRGQRHHRPLGGGRLRPRPGSSATSTSTTTSTAIRPSPRTR